MKTLIGLAILIVVVALVHQKYPDLLGGQPFHPGYSQQPGYPRSEYQGGTEPSFENPWGHAEIPDPQYRGEHQMPNYPAQYAPPCSPYCAPQFPHGYCVSPAPVYATPYYPPPVYRMTAVQYVPFPDYRRYSCR